MAEFDSVIPAGQSGKLSAKVHTRPTQHGKLYKGISVTTDAPGAQSIRLTMVLDVVAPIFVKPRFQLYINTVAGESAESRVLLRRSDGKPLEVSLAKPVSDEIKIDVLQVKKKEKVDQNTEAQPGDFWVVATIVEPKTVSTITGKVELKTNQPDLPVLTIPITVRVKSQIEARPAQVRIWITDQTKVGQSTVFRLTHNAGGNFAITNVTSSNTKVFAVSQITVGDSRSHQFKVELSEGFDLETIRLPLNGMITVETSSPAAPRITVPVLLSERTRLPPRPQGRQKTQMLQKSRQIVKPTRTPGAG